MDKIEIQIKDYLDIQAGEKSTFGEMFQSVNPMFSFSKRVWTPLMDIFETKEKIIIKAEMAGVKKEDIVIEASTKIIKISGNRKSYYRDKVATYRLAEIQFGPFERLLYLSNAIDVKKVSAIFSDGFLEIKLGKQVKHI